MNLKAWVSALPADGRKHPAVVYAHNGFNFSLEDWEHTLPYRRAGFVVVVPMERGESGNPGVFECCWGEVNDLLAAGEYAATLPEVDPGKVYLAGHDEGGTLAMLAAMMPSRFAAAAAIDAPTEIDRFRESSGNKLPFSLADANERMLRSPHYFPESVRCPLHLIVGEEDEALLPPNMDLARDAAQLGKPCRLWTVKGSHTGDLVAAVEKSIRIFQAAGRHEGSGGSARRQEVKFFKNPFPTFCPFRH